MKRLRFWFVHVLTVGFERPRLRDRLGGLQDAYVKWQVKTLKGTEQTYPINTTK